MVYLENGLLENGLKDGFENGLKMVYLENGILGKWFDEENKNREWYT